jgi:PAS domain S-box-containing protein
MPIKKDSLHQTNKTITPGQLRLQKVVEKLPFGFWALDSDLRYIIQNKNSRRKWGDVRGKTIDQIPFPPSLRAYWKSINQKALSGELINDEFTAVAEDSEITYSFITAPFYIGDHPAGVIGAALDVSSGKKKERKSSTKIKNKHVYLEQKTYHQEETPTTLQISEAWNEALIRAIPDAIFRCNREGEISFFKSSSDFQTVAPPEEFMGQPVSRFLPEDIAVRVIQTIERTLDSGQLQTIEYVLKPEDEVRVYEGRMVPCGREEVLVIVRDMTERKHTEETLTEARNDLARRFGERTRQLERINQELQREIAERQTVEEQLRTSEKRYRLLTENASDAIARLSPQGEVLYTSPATQRVLGFQEKDLEGVNIFDFVHPDDLEQMRGVQKSLLKRDSPMTWVCRLRRKDGEYGWVEASGQVVKDSCSNKVQEVICVTRDITDRKRTEFEIRDNSAFFSVLSAIRGVRPEDSEQRLWEVFLKTTVFRYNFRMAWYGRYRNHKITPWVSAGETGEYLDGLVLNIQRPTSPHAKCAASEAVLKKQPFGYNDMASDEGFRQWRDAALAQGWRANLALPVICEGRVEGAVLVYSSRVRDFPEDRVQRLAMLIQELGVMLEERRRKEEAERQRKKMEQMQKDFVANVSHEFKTPLTSIQGYAETLLGSKLTNKDQIRSFAATILDSAVRLSRLTDDLLRLSVIETGTPTIQLHPVDLCGVVDHCVRTIHSMAAQKKVDLHYECPEDLPQVQGDANRLNEILLNLLDNAIQYSSPGGEVHLTVYQHHEKVAMTVKDTGIGIPKEEIQRVFERFYRVDQARNRKKGGTGLGLAIVKQLVDMHGGHIEVESTPGKGSTFNVYLQPV